MVHLFNDCETPKRAVSLESAALSEVAVVGARQSLNLESSLENRDDQTSPKYVNYATVFTEGQIQIYIHLQRPHHLENLVSTSLKKQVVWLRNRCIANLNEM